jgi:acyl-coenzyme A thioesterase PaaI-like protein
MRNPTGGLFLAVLGIVSPDSGLVSDREAVPNPVVISIQVLDPGRDVRRIEIQSEGLKRGRQMSYSRSRIVDADNPSRVLALNEGQGVSIGVPPEGLEKMELNPIDVVDSPDLPPLWQVFGAARRPGGVWALPELSVEVASPDAALHIGPQFVVLETAALDAAAEVVGTDQLQGLSSHVMFLARGKAGPFRVDTQPIRGVDGTVAVRATMYDEGAGDKAITAASYVFAYGRG